MITNWLYIYIVLLLVNISVCDTIIPITEHPVNDEIVAVTMKMRGIVEEIMDVKFRTFVPVEAKIQLIDEKMYYVKVDTGEGNALFLKIFKYRSFHSVNNIIPNKTMNDALIEF